MKRAALYSSAKDARKPATGGLDEQAADAGEAPARTWRTRLRDFARRRRYPLLGIGAVALACAPVLVYWALQTPPQVLTQDDIDDAVVHTMETKSLPSRSARAADLVRESVVRVRGMLDDDDEDADTDAKAGGDKNAKGAAPKDKSAGKGKGADRDTARGPGRNRQDETGADTYPPSGGKPDRAGKADDKSVARGDAGKGKPGKGEAGKGGAGKPHEGLHEGNMSIGSGVVIVDKGVILTNNHVVAGAKKLYVTFFDGMESEAELVAVFPENDLAVLRAKRIPDDLPAATLGSSARLKPGDEVVAVGFPFDIGPSVSSGVVSGLNREFRSPKGDRVLSHLIQFDAAANSGNSGGPLVTMDGEVVGIVTAILNPHGAGTFIGIGFAVTIEGAGAAVGIPPF
ncbi:MAG TPA: trypsin-like peptidase domain-containing protein [Burkholderiales bacterium]|jgi:S1-C subfamily serine protease